MSKLIKDMIRDELKSRYSAVDSAVWVDFIGVDGLTNTEFRKGLHSEKLRIEVVKTSIFRRAVAGAPLARLAESMGGPAALITGEQSPVHIAKVLQKWKTKVKNLKLRGAVLEGELIDESRIADLHKMPTKRDVQGQIAGALRSPGARLAAAIAGPGSAIAGAVKALIAKLERSEPPAAAAEPAAEPAAAAPAAS